MLRFPEEDSLNGASETFARHPPSSGSLSSKFYTVARFSKDLSPSEVDVDLSVTLALASNVSLENILQPYQASMELRYRACVLLSSYIA